MLFIGIALLAAVGLALLVAADAGSLIGFTQDQTGRLLPWVILLVILGASLFARRMRVGQLFGGMAIWAVIFLVAAGGYTYRFEIAGIANRVIGELAPEAAIVSADGESVLFRRGLRGSFFLQAHVNDRPVRMIFDTGASAVVLTLDDARAAGIDVDRLRFGVPVQTANGTGQAAIVTLDEIDIGGIVRHDIRAYVAENGALDTSLLGMSFLETLQRYSVSQDTLELEG